MWFTIYFFHHSGNDYHSLSHANVTWSISSTHKVNFQYKTTGDDILVPVDIENSIFVIAHHCGCSCSRYILQNILAQEPSLNFTALLRYGLKTRMKVIQFVLQKLGRIFWPSILITKNVNILSWDLLNQTRTITYKIHNWITCRNSPKWLLIHKIIWCIIKITLVGHHSIVTYKLYG